MKKKNPIIALLSWQLILTIIVFLLAFVGFTYAIISSSRNAIGIIAWGTIMYILYGLLRQTIKEIKDEL